MKKMGSLSVAASSWQKAFYEPFEPRKKECHKNQRDDSWLEKMSCEEGAWNERGDWTRSLSIPWMRRGLGGLRECLKGLEAGEGGGTPNDPSLPLLHHLQQPLLWGRSEAGLGYGRKGWAQNAWKPSKCSPAWDSALSKSYFFPYVPPGLSP